MTDSEFSKKIKELSVKGGCYLFFGEEDYLKLAYAEKLTETFLGCEKNEYNFVSMYGYETSCEMLEGELNALPMFSPSKVVWLKSANISSWKEKERALYIELLSRMDSFPHVLLIIIANNGDFDSGILPKRPSALYKQFEKCSVPVQFAKKRGAQLIRWINKRCEINGVSMNYGAAEILITASCEDMNILAGEIEKLCSFVKYNGRCEITEEDIKEVASGNYEEEAFELSNAILDGDRTRALEAFRKMKIRRCKPPEIMGGVCRVMTDMMSISLCMSDGMDHSTIAAVTGMNPYKIKLYAGALYGVDTKKIRAALARVRDTDRQIKTTALGYTALERFICTIPSKKKTMKLR